MDECWCAFAVAIINHQYLTPEKAFYHLENGKPKNRAWYDAPRKDLTIQDVADMVRMKETMTYKQIGKIYGMKADAVYTRIRRFSGIIR